MRLLPSLADQSIQQDFCYQTSLIDKVDVLIIGGGMAYTFAKAAGGTVGDSPSRDGLSWIMQTK